MTPYPMSPVAGQMMSQPLLVSSIIEYAARHYGGAEIVSRRVEGEPLVHGLIGRKSCVHQTVACLPPSQKGHRASAAAPVSPTARARRLRTCSRLRAHTSPGPPSCST